MTDIKVSPDIQKRLDECITLEMAEARLEAVEESYEETQAEIDDLQRELNELDTEANALEKLVQHFKEGTMPDEERRARELKAAINNPNQRRFHLSTGTA